MVAVGGVMAAAEKAGVAAAEAGVAAAATAVAMDEVAVAKVAPAERHRECS
jgi:hypothetical protein